MNGPRRRRQQLIYPACRLSGYSAGSAASSPPRPSDGLICEPTVTQIGRRKETLDLMIADLLLLLLLRVALKREIRAKRPDLAPSRRLAGAPVVFARNCCRRLRGRGVVGALEWPVSCPIGLEASQPVSLLASQLVSQSILKCVQIACIIANLPFG